MLVPWKRGDTEPLRVTLTRNRKGQDIRGAAVVFNMQPVVEGVGSTVTRGSCDIIDAVKGIVEYRWQTTDVDTSGAHRAEFEVTWGDGTVKTFPDGGHLDLVIDDDLG